MTRLTTDPTARATPRWRTDPLWRVMPLLEVNWRRVASAVALGSLALGSAVGLAAASAWLIARASQMPPVLTLSVAIVAVRAFGISRGVFRYLERLASHNVALRGMSALRANLYERLAGGRSERLVTLRRGDLLARVGSDVDSVGDAVVKSLIPMGVAVVLSICSTVLVGAFLPWAGLALALCLLLAGVVAPWLSARTARTVEARGARARGEMTATVLEVLENAGPLAVSGRMGAQMESLRETDRELAAVTDDGAKTAGIAAGLLTAATGIAVLASLLLGIPAVEAGTLAAVELSVIVLTPLAAFEAVGVLPGAAVQWHRSSQAARRVLDLLDSEEPGGEDVGGPDGLRSSSVASVPSVVDPLRPSGPPTPDPTSSPPDEAITGSVLRLSGLACGWPGTGRTVLADLDLDLSPGRAVALVGASGIGKTTVLMTAAGLLSPVEGSATIDGSPLADLDPHDAAAHVVFAAEDGHVFDTTILENLRVASGDLTAEEAREALERVGLSDWVDALPEGVDTMLGPDATTISGGERRRLLVARALLATAPVLLVDEPAEHLDGPTADALTARLVEETERGRAVLLATHRLSSLDRMDEVLLLAADGEGPARVVARGTHEELVHTPQYRWALEQEQPV